MTKRPQKPWKPFLNCQNKKAQHSFKKGNKCIIFSMYSSGFYHKNGTFGAEVYFKIASSPANCLQTKRQYWLNFFKLMRHLSRGPCYLFMCHRFKLKCQKFFFKTLSCFISGIHANIARIEGFLSFDPPSYGQWIFLQYSILHSMDNKLFCLYCARKPPVSRA